VPLDDAVGDAAVRQRVQRLGDDRFSELYPLSRVRVAQTESAQVRLGEGAPKRI